jgi:2-methylisocitrate lyase-like PEP mutase family enzyme
LSPRYPSRPETIRTLVSGPLPVNVMAHPGALTVAQLAALGVTRISVGSAVAQSAYGSLEAAMAYDELNSLLRSR